MFKNYKFQKNTVINSKSGNDERFEHNEILVINDIEMKLLLEINDKKKVLDFLQSNQKSIFDKIDKINEFYGNSPKQIDLSQGGLFKDWNFEI
jgi:hypothetical protein